MLSSLPNYWVLLKDNEIRDWWILLYLYSLLCQEEATQVGLPGCTGVNDLLVLLISHPWLQWWWVAQISRLYRYLMSRQMKPEKSNPRLCIYLYQCSILLMDISTTFWYELKIRFCFYKLRGITKKQRFPFCFFFWILRNKHTLSSWTAFSRVLIY